MVSPDLQILLHGESISNAEVSLMNESGVDLVNVVRFANSNYLLLYLDLSRAIPQIFDIVLKNDDFESIIPYQLRERENNALTTFDSSDVVYLLMPDRFSRREVSKMSTPKMLEKTVCSNRPDARNGGNILGMQDRLGYLADLGVTAIWHTPLLENDMPEYSYHGYAITDYYKIDQRMGDNDAYREFVATAHGKGLKVIKDIVFNHCGNMNFLFVDMPSDDWFSNGGRFLQTSFRTGSMSDPHSSFHDRRLTTDGAFVESMPDFNQRNPYVMDYLIQCSIWWIEYAGIDGIRQDTYPYNDKSGMVKWCRAVEREYPGFNIVGETWVNHNVGVSYWQKESKVAAPFNSYLPTVMDFPLMTLLNMAVDEHTDEWSGLGRIYEYISQDQVYADTSHLLTFLDNHDTDRFQKTPSMCKNFDRYRQALTLLLTLRGIPQIYSGTEIGMCGNKSKGDGVLRKRFPGGWASDKRNAFNELGRTKLQQQYFAFTKRLLQWRKSCVAVAYGDLTHYMIRNGVYVYSRRFAAKTVTVIMNGRDRAVDFLLADYSEVLPDKIAFEVLSGRSIPIQESIKLEKRGIRILEF
jgi:glycosidase